jgi:hypothetical protein
LGSASPCCTRSRFITIRLRFSTASATGHRWHPKGPHPQLHPRLPLAPMQAQHDWQGCARITSGADSLVALRCSRIKSATVCGVA